MKIQPKGEAAIGQANSDWACSDNHGRRSAVE